MLQSSVIVRAKLLALVFALSGCASTQRGMERFDEWLGGGQSHDGRYTATCYSAGDTYSSALSCDTTLRKRCPNGFDILSTGASPNPNAQSFAEKYRITALAQCK
jgi:hypothetical protein